MRYTSKRELVERIESVRMVVEEFGASYEQILSLVQQLSSEELLTPGRFAWTGKHPLATYLGPNSCSHYAFAARVLRRWMKRKGSLERVTPALERHTRRSRRRPDARDAAGH